MNTVAVVWFVDEGEETACSYGTKLIQGLENLCQPHQRGLHYITVQLCFLFLIRYPKTKENKEQKGYCFSKVERQVRLMDQLFSLCSFYSVDKIIQMNSSQLGPNT